MVAKRMNFHASIQPTTPLADRLLDVLDNRTISYPRSTFDTPTLWIALALPIDSDLKHYGSLPVVSMTHP
jgi:hypothetical protein